MGMCCVCCAGEVEAKANGSHKDKMKGTGAPPPNCCKLNLTLSDFRRPGLSA